MTFWVKSLQVFNSLCENGAQSVRRIAHKTGFAKSSVHQEGTYPVACPGCPRGFLVGGREAGLGAGDHLVAVEAVGQGVPAAMGLLGAPGGPHALRTPESQETAGMGGSVCCVSHA